MSYLEGGSGRKGRIDPRVVRAAELMALSTDGSGG